MRRTQKYRKLKTIRKKLANSKDKSQNNVQRIQNKYHVKERIKKTSNLNLKMRLIFHIRFHIQTKKSNI